jgi:hypothetical protein
MQSRALHVVWSFRDCIQPGKKTFYTTMSGSARAGSSSGLSLPKWQIALAIGAPVALGKFFLIVC